VNTIMQTCFFAISGVLPKDEAIAAIKRSIKKTYGKKGEDIVKMNFDAVDHTLANLFKVQVPAKVDSTLELPPVVSAKAPDFVKNVLAKIIAGVRQRPSGERHADRRNISDRHGCMGEAEHRSRNSGVGRKDLYPVRQVRTRLPRMQRSA